MLSYAISRKELNKNIFYSYWRIQTNCKMLFNRPTSLLKAIRYYINAR